MSDQPAVDAPVAYPDNYDDPFKLTKADLDDLKKPPTPRKKQRRDRGEDDFGLTRAFAALDPGLMARLTAPRDDAPIATPEEQAEVDREIAAAHVDALKIVKPTAEIVQTLDRLRGMDGQAGAIAFWQAQLQLATERDALLAARADIHPACFCWGLGGTGWAAIVVPDPDKPATPDQPPGVLFSEIDGPKSWRKCCVCPEGLAAAAAKADALAAMYERGMQRRAERMLGTARIPAKYASLTLATFPDQVVAVRAERWLLYALDKGPVDERFKKMLLIHGPNRRGKTGVSLGLLKIALARKVGGIFRSVSDLLGELRATYDKENPACHSVVLAALKDTPFLVLDDLGVEQWSGWAEEIMYAIVNHRSIELKPTVFTTNLGWPDGATKYDSTELFNAIGERIWWRIEDSANKMAMHGPILGLDAPARPALRDVKPDLEI